jgi:REP element-mobilizing transposase RayT
MSRPLRIEYPRGFYHVTSRGNERKAVFLCDLDREQFLSYIQVARERDWELEKWRKRIVGRLQMLNVET